MVMRVVARVSPPSRVSSSSSRASSTRVHPRGMCSIDDHSGCETGGYAQIGFGFYRLTVYTYACFCGCWRLVEPARANE